MEGSLWAACQIDVGSRRDQLELGEDTGERNPRVGRPLLERVKRDGSGRCSPSVAMDDYDSITFDTRR